MSDYLADTPYVGRAFCPTCEPDVDPLAEIVESRYRYLHAPATSGADDAGVRLEPISSGGGEAHGADCRAFANFLKGAR